MMFTVISSFESKTGGGYVVRCSGNVAMIFTSNWGTQAVGTTIEINAENSTLKRDGDTTILFPKAKADWSAWGSTAE